MTGLNHSMLLRPLTPYQLFPLLWVARLADPTAPPPPAAIPTVLACTEDDELNGTLSRMVLQKILTNNSEYDKNLVPGRRGTTVKIEISIQSIEEVSEITASFTSDILFRFRT